MTEAETKKLNQLKELNDYIEFGLKDAEKVQMDFLLHFPDESEKLEKRNSEGVESSLEELKPGILLIASLVEIPKFHAAAMSKLAKAAELAFELRHCEEALEVATTTFQLANRCDGIQVFFNNVIKKWSDSMNAPDSFKKTILDILKSS